MGNEFVFSFDALKLSLPRSIENEEKNNAAYRVRDIERKSCTVCEYR